ncbi:MAG: CehA/McbA family metallohydrolase [Bacillota bacterium]|nr:CehA/McbA family metallohydrolase [Bacillota bacterium]
MRFDMHCHTKEGSIDSKVSVRSFADSFLKLGYDGFMISDHNSYRGCREWDAIADEPQYRNLTVIRGIEYDTKDAGHVLVIMPDGVYLKMLKIRGMRAEKLISTVHRLGGILGLAHPYGAASSSAMGFTLMNMDLVEKFDFIEAFNTCEFAESNRKAVELAAAYDKPCFAGSDSHVTDYIGMAETVTDCDIRSNNDLIHAVKSGAAFCARGTEREITKKAIRKEHWFGIMGYKIYNRGIGKTMCLYRKYQHRKLFSHA